MVATGTGTANLTVASKVVTTSGGANWLSASAFNASIAAGGSASISITVDPGRLPATQYSGTVTITADGAQTVINVIFTVYIGTDLQLTATGVPVTASVGSTQPISYTEGFSIPNASVSNSGSCQSPNGNNSLTLCFTPSASWLSAKQLNSIQFQVTVNPTGLAAHDYSGDIQIVANTGAPAMADFTVTLTIASSGGPTQSGVNPASLAFQLSAGGAPNSQALSVTPNGSSAYFTATPSTNDGSDWLQVDLSSATAPHTINVTATPGNLRPGNYSGNVQIVMGSASIPVPVSLTLTPTAAIQTDATSITLNASSNSCTPQTVNVSSSDPTVPLPFSVSAQAGLDAWLTASPTSGNAPAAISVNCNTAGLASGSYTATLVISSAQSTNSSVKIPVSFNFGSTLPAPALISPANGAMAVSLSPNLTWSSSTGATSYDVYFGTSSTPALATNTTTTAYSPGALQTGTTYYWSVTAKNSSTTATSATWSFITAAAPPAKVLTISTLAGGGVPTDPTKVPLAQVASLAADSSGGVYFSDWLDWGAISSVFRVDPSGSMATVAGNGTWGYSGDGAAATSAQLYGPAGVAVDSSNNVYIADRFNGVVREVSKGVISTLAGQFHNPIGLAADGSGNVYVAEGPTSASDSNGNAIRKISASGAVSTVAGGNGAGYTGDGGAAVRATFNFTPGAPIGMAFDASGNLYVADTGNNVIRKITPSLAISTITVAGLKSPSGVAIDLSGNLYIADTGNGVIRKIDASSNFTTIATNLPLASPSAITVDGNGNIFVYDSGALAILKIDASGNVATYAGSFGANAFWGDGGPATAAGMEKPTAVAADTAGRIYIADAGNGRLRVITPDGNINSIALSGVTPYGVTVDPAGNPYVIDGYLYLRKILPDGSVQTVAGNGKSAFSGDNGAATSAGMHIDGAAIDGASNVYIADAQNNRIRKITPDGTITTIAGNGTASSALFKQPTGIAVDGANNIYVLDQGNNRVSEISAKDGTISTVAGNGSTSDSGDGGPATSAGINANAIAADAAGNLYLADGLAVRQVTVQGTINTIAGGSAAGYSGDGGPALGAQWHSAWAIVVDASGAIYICDGTSGAIRKIQY